MYIKFAVTYTYNNERQEIVFSCMDEATEIARILSNAGYKDAVVVMKAV